MSEPTGTLTFKDLIIEVARKWGVTYLGADGSGENQVPQDPHDLAECKRHVNNAIRMIIADAPRPAGWRWLRPTAQVVLWGTISAAASRTITSAGLVDEDKTLLTANIDTFYPTMELKSIVITDIGTFTITDYVSATQIKVSGDATAAAAKTFSITADGNYTLPADFSGQYAGSITYAAATNVGATISWSDEGTIRRWREDTTTETGDPFLAAVRIMASGDPRRRWELMVQPIPDEVMTLEFPYDRHFDRLIYLDEVPPLPFGHDETVKAACLAIVEKDVFEKQGTDWQYYQQVALPNSHRIDGRSAPRRLGSVYGPTRGPRGIQDFRSNFYNRPTVNFNP